ncbi:heavy-metal-associated domain-containing protein [Halanaerobium saccharolyticum]|uniref:Copper chaperone CopZ n=1 Tax=Halanaerobium saccharolyticum TaxID=43595 RepID=A0A4R7YUY6_9FIRM|nr:heavy metal-associated domain-containing protein [Halanaerobium saccharolyticum]RAK06468.1 heavy-metal-associated domain-containing protein [Halanaerobium saccharolyticum]TDW01012.1 heavy-metal-associated domain-containing protein [Halanaerobium saccharolyticum]TDX52593.1 heavy-metal-associated domain-containing protein [Halanaerobium saccharolyticum]
MKKIKLYLEELSCPDCANKVEKVLSKTEGVTEADVHYTTSKANVKYDPAKINPDGLKKAVAKTGYQVEKTK